MRQVAFFLFFGSLVRSFIAHGRKPWFPKGLLVYERDRLSAVLSRGAATFFCRFRLHPKHLFVDPAPAYVESPDLLVGTYSFVMRPPRETWLTQSNRRRVQPVW